MADRATGYWPATVRISSSIERELIWSLPIEAMGQGLPAENAQHFSRLSPVALPHHGVQRPDDRDHVRDEGVPHAGGRRLEGDERRAPELHPPRARPAVRDDVAAHLAAGRLDRHVDLALGHAVPLGDD